MLKAIQMTKVSFPDGSEVVFIGPFVYRRVEGRPLEPTPFNAGEASSFFGELERKSAQVEQRMF